MKKKCCKSGQSTEACEEKVRQLAYEKWEKAGKPEGDDGQKYWLLAEKELKGECED